MAIEAIRGLQQMHKLLQMRQMRLQCNNSHARERKAIIVTETDHRFAMRLCGDER